VLARFWTEEHSVRDELFLQTQLSVSELFAVYFLELEAWLSQLVSPPRFLSGQDSSGRNEKPLQRATVLYKEVFLPLMCQAPWAKLCAAPVPERRTTSQETESKELKSQLCTHLEQMLQKINLGAIKDVIVCDTKIANTGNTKLPLPCMPCVIPTCSISFLTLFLFLAGYLDLGHYQHR